MTKLFHILTIWSLFFSQITLAVDFTIKQDYTLRQTSADGLKVVAQLPKGTVLRIPDEYFGTELKGKLKDEAALINWLKSAGKLKKFVTKSGAVKRDYFFPVEVVKSPGNKVPTGKSGEIAIRYLAKKGNLDLITVADAPLIESSSQVAAAKDAEDCVECRGKTAGQVLFDDIKGKLESIFGEIEDGAQEKVSAKSYPDIFIENFNKTCGMDFYKFLGELKEEALTKGIPPEILLGMMSQESEGKCDAVHKDSNGTYSVGLFQINTASTSLKFGDLKNPQKNMKEAIRILIDKYKKVNKGKSPRSKIPVKMMSEEELTKWKKALSAYNGGEGHLYQSEKDLRAISKRYGLKLDPEDWETRRTFYFRKYIEENTEAKFDNKYSQKRSTDNSIANLIYVESILGMKGVNGSLAETWYPELKRQITEDPTVNEDQKRKEEERQKRLEEERKRREEEARRLEEERKRKEEEERKRLEEEKRRAEEEAKRLEEEQKRREEEQRRLDEEQKRREEKQKQLEEERKRRQEAAAKAEEEERKRKEEQRKRDEEERKRLEEEKRQAEEAERIKRAEEVIRDFNLSVEEAEKKREQEYARKREEYQRKQEDEFKKWQREQEELEKIRKERERIEEENRLNEEVIRLNNSNVDNLENTFRKFNRTTILGIARLEYNLSFRNTNPTYSQKCTIYVQSFYNQVNDEDKHTFIIRPGETKKIDGTLKKPWVGQGGRVVEDCEYLPLGYKEKSSTRYDSRGGRR